MTYSSLIYTLFITASHFRCRHSQKRKKELLECKMVCGMRKWLARMFKKLSTQMKESYPIWLSDPLYKYGQWKTLYQHILMFVKQRLFYLQSWQ